MMKFTNRWIQYKEIPDFFFIPRCTDLKIMQYIYIQIRITIIVTI